MKKSRAAIALVLTAVITALMAYTAVVGLGAGHRGSYHNIVQQGKKASASDIQSHFVFSSKTYLFRPDERHGHAAGAASAAG